ncbi:Protein of unknown function [Bacillus cereus]|nr:Protein of unknown function [Bacillus cereus]
MMNETMILGR